MGTMLSRDIVKNRALKIGFDLIGVAPIGAWQDLEFSRQWVERGFSGEMRYLANPKRHDTRSVLPSTRSVVSVGLVYNASLPYSVEVEKSGVRSQESEGEASDGQREPFSNFDFRISDATEGPRAWISRYAWGRDYHQVMRTKLEKLRAAIQDLGAEVETRVFVDTGPIVERAFARLSGIGWMGKNTCLLNQEKGSWFFLGVILTNLALAPDLPAPDRCGSCTRCIEACPTGALVEPYVMDASRCIAYFNIELKGSIPAEFREAIGRNVFGCDICQDVCPWNGEGRSQKLEARSQKENADISAMGKAPLSAHSKIPRRAATTLLPEFQPLKVEVPSPQPLTPSPCSPSPQSPAPSIPHLAPGTFSLFNPPLETLACMSEADFRRAFAKSPIKRVKYRGWLRNLCVAMGNSGDPRFIPKLQELTAHPDPNIREHVAWALERIQPKK